MHRLSPEAMNVQSRAILNKGSLLSQCKCRIISYKNNEKSRKLMNTSLNCFL